MSEIEISLPAGWRWVKLGEVCRVFTGSAAPQGKEYFDKNGPLFFRVSDLGKYGRTMKLDASQDRLSQKSLSECNLVFAKAGTVIFPKSGAAIATNNRALLASEGYIVSHLIALDSSTQTLSEWLYYVMCQINMMDYSDNTGYPSLKQSVVETIEIPLPPLPEQKRIVVILNERIDAIEKARVAAEAQLSEAKKLFFSYIYDSLRSGKKKTVKLSECIIEITKGIGSSWSQYNVLGATRNGLAPAKDNVGKTPERYKFIDKGTIFYNPMRILLGSIAFVDLDDDIGITSPDYVAFKTQEGLLHFRWFYYWLRSPIGELFIRSLTRGAVRERMLFKRLSSGLIEIPTWESQKEAAEKIRKIKPLFKIISTQIKEIHALPQSMLRKAFKGEL